MYLINHIELKHKTKLLKSRGWTNCVPQSNIELAKVPDYSHDFLGLYKGL